jgi:hypothetical protein
MLGNMIDKNPREKEAMEWFTRGDFARGNAIQNEFLREVKSSGMDHCSCTADCRHHGNCVDCVVIHRGHQDHLPNCFHEMVNERLAALAGLTEHKAFKD